MLTRFSEDLLEGLGKKLSPNFDVLRADERNKQFWVGTSAERVVEGAKYLLGTDGRLVHISAIDFGLDGFKSVYSFSFGHLERSLHVHLVAVASREEPAFPSLAAETYQASWAEREIMELLGLRFEGHPDPRKLFLPYEWPRPVESASPESQEEWVTVSAPGTNPMACVVPLGPYHPLLIEGGYFRIRVDGEEIVDADAKVGFNHRGIMKLMETRNYWRNVYIAERVCGICNVPHATAYCTTVERLAGVEVPDRAKYVRAFLLELNRIRSHLLWTGVAGDLVGFRTLFMWAWKIREWAAEAMELTTGNRIHASNLTIGGVIRDLDQHVVPKVRTRLKRIKEEVENLIDIISDHRVFRDRTEDIGLLDLPSAREMGAVGPTARGSGWDIDTRRDNPYAAYGPGYTTWEVITSPGCDVWSRVVVRAREMLVSLDVCEQCLDALAREKGPIAADVKEIPPGEVMGEAEAPRGELAYYIVSDGSEAPYCVRIRTPSYRNIALLPKMLRGYTIGDAPIIIGSVDPCFACTDRVTIVDVRRGRQVHLFHDEFTRMARRRSR